MDETTTRIGDAIRGARGYLREHPAEAGYTDSAALARWKGGLAVAVEGPDGATLQTDMPSSIGGSASAPSPGWFLRAAHASCVAALVAMRAAEQGIALSSLEVAVESDSDDRGILDAADDVPSGPLRTRVRISVAAKGAAEAAVRQAAEWGWRHCPVDDAVRRAVPVEVEVEAVTGAKIG